MFIQHLYNLYCFIKHYKKENSYDYIKKNNNIIRILKGGGTLEQDIGYVNTNINDTIEKYVRLLEENKKSIMELIETIDRLKNILELLYYKFNDENIEKIKAQLTEINELLTKKMDDINIG